MKYTNAQLPDKLLNAIIKLARWSDIYPGGIL